MNFVNATDLDSARLERLLLRHTHPYRHERLTVRVRYSRGADFSGTCYYATARLFINIGRANRYPYLLGTHVARSQSNRTHWWRETYRLRVENAEQLVLFVYLHELYHFLVHAAGRNPRRKESMCDRFATRALVDDHGACVIDAHGRPVPRSHWDIKDVHAFVAGAPKIGPPAPVTLPRPAVAQPPLRPAAREIPVTILGVRPVRESSRT